MKRVSVVGRLGADMPVLPPCTLLVGAERHLSDVDSCAERVILGPLAPAIERILGHDGDVVVVGSGDPGFFGIVRALREAGITPIVEPALSSVTTAFARLGLSWDDAIVVSAHGRSLRRAANVCRAHPKVAVLTAPGAGPDELAALLADVDRTLVVAECLGTAAERLTTFASSSIVSPVATGDASPSRPASPPGLASSSGLASPSGVASETSPEAAAGDAELVGRRRIAWREPNLVIVLDPARDGGGSAMGWVAGAQPGPAGWALPETAFAHRDSMITKAEVRAWVLAKLGPRLGDLVWDVGAGSGSVAIECARFGAAVIAIDSDPQAAIAARDAGVRVVTGEAPACLDGLPDPDAVFVGGGGLPALRACADRRPQRIVAAFAALERVTSALAMLDGAGYAAEAVQLQASRLAPLPDGSHRLSALNPVFVVSGAMQ